MLRENDLLELPKEVGSLSRLRELHIQGNRLTVLPPEIGEAAVQTRRRVGSGRQGVTRLVCRRAGC